MDDQGPTPDVDANATARALVLERDDASFKAWVQYRYHRKRQRFFDHVDKAVKSLTIVLGGTIVSPFFPDGSPYLAAGISIIGVVTLIYGPDDRKHIHSALAERFMSLAVDIKAVPTAHLKPRLTAGWLSRFAQIAAGAPPQLKALTIMCEHEHAQALGLDPPKTPLPGKIRRFFAVAL